jgi:hypothetical protein
VRQVYDPRELPGLTTDRPRVVGLLQSPSFCYDFSFMVMRARVKIVYLRSFIVP